LGLLAFSYEALVCNKENKKFAFISTSCCDSHAVVEIYSFASEESP